MMRVIVAAAALALAAAAPPAPAAAPARTETALFAGGCFWSTEKLFEGVPGVVDATSGFAGGRVPNPSYERVLEGDTGHRETVKVTFDPARVSYAKLVDAYLHAIDPSDAGGTFCDRGPSYRTGIFALTAEQRAVAGSALKALNETGRFRGRVATQLLPAAPFYPAEAYHQDFWRRNPVRYNGYRIGCGRDAALARAWGGNPG